MDVVVTRLEVVIKGAFLLKRRYPKNIRFDVETLLEYQRKAEKVWRPDSDDKHLRRQAEILLDKIQAVGGAPKR